MTLSLSQSVSLLIIWANISFFFWNISAMCWKGVCQPRWEPTGGNSGWLERILISVHSSRHNFRCKFTLETVNKICSISRKSWHGMAESDKHYGGLLAQVHSYFIHAACCPLALPHFLACPHASLLPHSDLCCWLDENLTRIAWRH